MDDFELELQTEFLQECEELLENTEEAFMRLEEERDNPEVLEELFRLAHNLKGTSKAVGFDSLSELTHEAESLILKIQKKEIVVSDEAVSLLLSFNDEIRSIVETLTKDPSSNIDVSVMKARIIDFIANPTQGESTASVSAEPVVEAENSENEALDSERALYQNLDAMLNEPVAETPSGEDEAVSKERALYENLDAMLQGDDVEVEENKESDEISKERSLYENLDAMLKEGSSPSAESSASDELSKERDLYKNLDQMLAQGNEAESNENNEIKEERDKYAELDKLLKSGGEASTEEKPKLEEVPSAKVLSMSQAKKEKPKVKKEADQAIRVDLTKIDKINNLIGELVIAQTILSQRRFSHIEDDLANKSITELDKLCNGLHKLSMSLRMVPLKSTFQKMNRIVRDTSKALDKKVNLVLTGETTEVDKIVLDKLTDPLVHIVRNAVDHGLETSDNREILGKDPVGNIRIEAFHEGNNLIIMVEDDGNGIDPKKIHEKAISKGIVSPSKELTEKEILDFIFHPGFSTKEQVTEVSGRGVGMDVVKQNISVLGGSISLNSEIGKGSKFRISLPLTMAVIEGLVIHADDEKFVLPLSQVDELVMFDEEKLESFSGAADLFRLRGETLNTFYLNKKLRKKDSKKAVLLVLRSLEKPIGIIIDEVSHQQQIVVKKLEKDIKNTNGVMGAAILADGLPSMILDLAALYRNDIKIAG